MKSFPRLVQGFLLAAFALRIVAASAAAPSPSIKRVAGDNTAFAVDLYHRESGASGNLFFSPYSISTALAMTYAGAYGQTADEMARVLHFSQSRGELNQGFLDLSARFQQIESGKQVSLSVANSLWCQEGYRFDPGFTELNQKYYDVELRNVNFSKEPEEVRKLINAWIDRKTRDKIPELLKPGQIDPMTRLLLCDAIYFKGNWAEQFDPKATRKEAFFVSSNRTVSVPMMSHRMKVAWRAFDDFTMFSLPYAGGDLSMIILLPEQKDGLAALESSLNPSTLDEWLNALDGAVPGEATVELPKFQLNRRLDLAHTLSAMGMPSAFGPGADFSGMDGNRDLYISGVAHQAYVEVNEQGTEAAAATGVTMRALSVMRPLILTADHPFLFFIRERQTGSILFLGRVMDPTQP